MEEGLELGWPPWISQERALSLLLPVTLDTGSSAALRHLLINYMRSLTVGFIDDSFFLISFHFLIDNNLVHLLIGFSTALC